MRGVREEEAVRREGQRASERELLAWRPEFPILQSSTYLISNSLGAMPAGVRAALAGYAEQWEHDGVGAWESAWWPLAQQVGDDIGRVIGAPPGSVSVHQNVTVASAVAASCFDFAPPRNGIVCTDLNFPSIVQLYRQLERRGARLHLVESDDGIGVPLERLLAAIDETTLLVPISHVIFRSSFLQDAAAVIERAHDVGAHVVLDVYQSAGIMPLQLESSGVDFAVGGVLKWLCGGPGVGYLYVRPDLAARLEPAITGWFARQNPFAFEPADASWADGAWRFLNGTTHIPALSAARPGLEILGQLDLEAVRSKSIRQTERLVEAARAHGWRIHGPTDSRHRGGHVTLDPPGAESIAAQLMRRRIMIDYRPGSGIRLAPHFYTTDEEIDRAVAAIAELSA